MKEGLELLILVFRSNLQKVTEQNVDYEMDVFIFVCQIGRRHSVLHLWRFL